jgi:hypothetical protein
MRGLDPRIHVLAFSKNDVDGRDKPGHDGQNKGERLSPSVSTRYFHGVE